MVKHGKDHCPKPMSLSEKLDVECGSPFGKLVSENMKRKIIAVENGEPNSYFREKLQEQIVRLVTSRVSEPYTNDTFQEVCQFRCNCGTPSLISPNILMCACHTLHHRLKFDSYVKYE